jgi:hypothetical protein
MKGVGLFASSVLLDAPEKGDKLFSQAADLLSRPCWWSVGALGNAFMKKPDSAKERNPVPITQS